MKLPEGEKELEDLTELWISNLLRAGVLLAAAVVLIGAVLYIARHGRAHPQLHVFAGEPQDLRTLGGIVRDLGAGRGRGVIQMGVLLLIATPIARVVLSVAAFTAERDRTYVLITLLVLVLLLFGLLGGGVG